jgi:hypothetical protein
MQLRFAISMKQERKDDAKKLVSLPDLFGKETNWKCSNNFLRTTLGQIS